MITTSYYAIMPTEGADEAGKRRPGPGQVMRVTVGQALPADTINDLLLLLCSLLLLKVVVCFLVWLVARARERLCSLFYLR